LVKPTFIVADALVQVQLGIDLLAVHVGEAGPEDVAVIDPDVLSGSVEAGHCD
jgi:hypothetical protein